MTPENDTPIIYSIGHSDHELETFLTLLCRQEITTVVDVRSQPYSRWVPQANREILARSLEEAGLTYVFMGDVLGGRPSTSSLQHLDQPGGQSDYERIAGTPGFQAGLQRLLKMARDDNLAIMCSEGDHRRCHRTHLITPHLLECGARVIHIQPSGETIEAQPEPKQLTLF